MTEPFIADFLLMVLRQTRQKRRDYGIANVNDGAHAIGGRGMGGGTEIFIIIKYLRKKCSKLKH